MGMPIAIRLAAAGADVSAFDPVVAAPAGVRAVADAAALAASVDTLVSVLPGRAELMDAAPGILRSLRPSSTWLDLTSGDPSLATLLVAAAAARDIAMVSAPMGGGPAEAAAGTLTFFIGGPDAVVEPVMPVLRMLGSGLERVGAGPGDGQTLKLLVNLLWFGQAAAVTEAVLLGQRLGLTEDALRHVLPRTAAGSRFLDEYLGRLLDGDDVETFGIDRVVEELETLRNLAGESPFEVSAAVTRLHREALERFGAVDGELLVARLLRERAREE